VFRSTGGLCINSEAGQIFYLTRAEKSRILQIAIEEAGGQVPISAGTWALTTEETVETARDVKSIIYELLKNLCPSVIDKRETVSA
jgi:dihydrodipicolinate synthase/N-acetylneuraminate lyase